MGPNNIAATSLEELGSTKTYRRSKHTSKRVEVPNLAHQTAKSELLVIGCCEGEGKARHSFNIHPKALHGSQRLFMGPKYNVATNLELRRIGESSKTYRRRE